MPNFVSPGGMAGNAIEQFLMQRAMQERQQQLDALMQRKQEEDISLRTGDLALRQSQELRQADAQKQAAADLEKERQFRRANTIAENALPGDNVDDPTRQLLEGQGFGGQLKKVPGIVSQGPMLEEMSEANGQIPTYGVTQQPDSVTMRGGSKYIGARVAADERAQLAEQAEAGRNERASADQALRAHIAELAASGRADSVALSNEIKRLQAMALGDKIETQHAEKDKAAGAVATGRAEVRDLAKSLLDDPALDGITGAFEGRRDTFFDGKAVDAKRRLDQLVNKLSLESRGKMKGQGQVSDFEGRMLASAVSAIDRAAGPEVVKKHLQEIVDAFSGDAPNESNAPPKPGGGGGFRVVGVR